MTLIEWSLVAGAAFALQAAILGLVNLRRYRRAAHAPPDLRASVSVCIPARNEESNIETCVRSVLANATATGLAVEVLCYDDQSTDQTPRILAALAAEDERVRLVPTVSLPKDWNGKQHACWRLAGAARHDWLLFTDADVRFAPDALRRAIHEAERHNAALLSTVPQQIAGTVGEALLIPLIHVLLLSYLPMGRMRRTLDPAASAGCGQFLLARADAYRAAGGHAVFRASMHDGIKMPRAFRAAGFRTDLFDGTDLVSCRMYHGFSATWRGFAKNAFEGLGSVALLIVLTVMHLAGHVWPWVFLAWAVGTGRPSDVVTLAASIAVGASVVERLVLAGRFRQPLWIAAAHPLAILLMTGVQWHSLLLAMRGRRIWKGRGAEAEAILVERQ